MIDQGMKGTVFAGEVSVEGLAGYLQIRTQVADGDLIILRFCHHGQQALLQLTLPIGGLFCFAELIHRPPPDLVTIIIADYRDASIIFVYFDKVNKEKLLRGVTKGTFWV
jgi:hypothetical protein